MRTNSLLLGLAFSAVSGLIYGLPPPCSELKLLETSDFAVKGFVVEVECGEPYDSQQCVRDLVDPDEVFRPELVSDCVATVWITETLKGNYSPGEEVKIPFVKLVRRCENGRRMIPGLPLKDFRLNSKVEYYNSNECAFWNFQELTEPFLRGDANCDGKVDIADPAYILNCLFGNEAEGCSSGRNDTNYDQTVDIADPVYLLNHLFAGGPEPPPPFEKTAP